MTRTVLDRISDVRRLVDAARTLAVSPTLREALIHATGLSREGVDLALSRHLETSPREEDLRSLVALAGDAPRVHVVLSANVFVGALRALAFARAAAPRVTVTPSRREPAFARALVAEASDAAVALEDALAIESVEEGEIHVYGRDETIAEVRARAAKGVRVRGHGSGLGIACVSARADPKAAAEAIAADVAPFDQRGCLSPRAVLVEGDAGRAVAVCVELDRALAAEHEHIPRGALSREELAEAARYASAVAFAGRTWRGPGHLVGLVSRGTALVFAPPGRHVHVAVVDGEKEARALLAPVSRFIAAVGFDDPAFGRAVVDRRVRMSSLGHMQKPPLDGPVDLRDL